MYESYSDLLPVSRVQRIPWRHAPHKCSFWLHALIPELFTMATDIRVEPLKEPIAAKLREECRSSIYPAASVRLFPSGCAHTAYFLQYAERFRDFEVRQDDVWVVSYPKCGKHKYAVMLQNKECIQIYCYHPVVYYYIVQFYNRQHNKFVIDSANRTAERE
jgi:hypothetical protein